MAEKKENSLFKYIKDKMTSGGMADRAHSDLRNRSQKVQDELDKAMGIEPKYPGAKK